MKKAVNGVRRRRLFLDKSVKPLSSAVSCMPMLICFHFLMNYYNKAKTVVNVLLDIKSLSHQEEINLYPVDNTTGFRGFRNSYPINYPVDSAVIGLNN